VRVRAAASVALVAVVAALLAGCTLFMQPETQQPYNPTDGINAQVGELKLRNVLVVTDDGVDGNLVMVVENPTERAIKYTLQYDADGTKTTLTLRIKSHETIQYGFGEGGQLLLAGINIDPGGLLPLYVQYGTEPGKLLQVPVLDGNLPLYNELLPTPTPTPTPEPTDTATPEPTTTPAP